MIKPSFNDFLRRSTGEKPTTLLEHRRLKRYESSLGFEFIRECLKINKIRPKFHFLRKIEINDSLCVFVLFFTVSWPLEQYNSKSKTSIKRLPNGSGGQETVKTKQKHKVSHFYFYFCPKMEFRTYFVCSQTFSYKFKSNELPQSLGCLWLANQSKTKKEYSLASNSQYTDAVLSFFSFFFFSPSLNGL